MGRGGGPARPRAVKVKVWGVGREEERNVRCALPGVGPHLAALSAVMIRSVRGGRRERRREKRGSGGCTAEGEEGGAEQAGYQRARVCARGVAHPPALSPGSAAEACQKVGRSFGASSFGASGVRGRRMDAHRVLECPL